MTKVSLIVLNYNGLRFLASCLNSINNLKVLNFELEKIIVDNASTDGSVAEIKSKYKDFNLIINEKNLGFAGGINKGIKQASGSIIVTLNIDVVLDPNFLVAALEQFQDPQVGAVAGKVLRLNNKKVIDSTGHVVYKNRLFIDRGDGEVDKGQYDQVEEIFGACAGIGVYRKAMLEDVKINEEYFDEDFFLFLEDTDLNWRAQLFGWKTIYTPKAVAYHWRGGVAARGSYVVEKNNYKNRYLMLIKNDSWFSLAKILPQLVLTDFLKTVGVFSRSPRSFVAGVKETILLAPKMWKKRSIIQAKKRVYPQEVEKWFVPFPYRQWILKHLRRKVGS